MPVIRVVGLIGVLLSLLYAGITSVNAQERGDTAHIRSASNLAEEIASSARRTGGASESSPAATGATQSQSAPTDKWQFQLTPYLFIAGLKGTARIGDRTAQVDASFGDILDELNFGFMAIFEARKNKLVLLTDALYISLSDSKATPGPLFSSAEANFKAFILDHGVGYNLARREGAALDVVGGIRYWHLSVELDFSAGTLPAAGASGSRNWVDAVVGLRGKAHLSPRWFVVGKGDFGGGGSNFTYQLFGGVGAQICKSVSLVVGYRDLDVDYDRSGFKFDMAIKGPVLGVGIKF